MPEEAVKREAPETGQTLEPPKDDAAYSEWRLTGKVEPQKGKPEKGESVKEPEPGEEPEGKEDEPEEGEADAAKPEKREARRKSDAATRLQEIIADLKRAGLTPSQLKTFKAQASQAQAQAAVQQQQPPPQPQPQPQPPPKLTDPQMKDYQDWTEFWKAHRAYNSQETRQEVRELFQQMWQQQLANQQAQQRLAEARQMYGADGEQSIMTVANTLGSDQSIPVPVKHMLHESPLVHHLLYVIGSDPEAFAQFQQTARTNPTEAIRQVVKLEEMVKDALHARQQAPNGNGKPAAEDSERERDEGGRFVKREQQREAPPPAREVSGRGGPPPNEAEAAFHRNDVRGYMAAKNREQIAARKGR